MKTKKRFRVNGTNYQWTMTGWQATAIVLGSVCLSIAGIYAWILVMVTMPL